MNIHTVNTKEISSLAHHNKRPFSILDLLSNIKYYNKISYSQILKRIHYIGIINFLKNELSVLDEN